MRVGPIIGIVLLTISLVCVGYAIGYIHGYHEAVTVMKLKVRYAEAMQYD